MPKSAAVKRKLELSRDTLRSLTEAKDTARGFVTTRGPTEIESYCGSCWSEYCTSNNC
jgi:hypothetical protein